MIFTQENECIAVLDACVLVPMALADLLLRLAEEPATYRPLWSPQILDEMARALKTKMGRSQEDIQYRRREMTKAFPEAVVTVPADLLKAAECIPDSNDRHVLAAAIMGHAHIIVTQNIRHFPKDCLARFNIVCQPAADFLIQQYDLHPQLVLDKLDDQAAGISRDRKYVIESLRASVEEFCVVLEGR